MFQTVVQRVLF